MPLPNTGPTNTELSATTDRAYAANEQLDLASFNFSNTEDSISISPSLINLGDSTKGTLALYLMPAVACANCLNEADEYVGLLNTEYSDLNLDQILWFHGEFKQYTRQFALVADIQLPKIYSQTNFLPPRLTVFKNETVDSQLILIDKATEQVIFRVHLPKGMMTPVEEKEVILDELASLLEFHTS